MLFYIKAKVSVKVRGISGYSQEGVSCLIHGKHEKDALVNFGKYCNRRFARMEPDHINYEYLEIAPEVNI